MKKHLLTLVASALAFSCFALPSEVSGFLSDFTKEMRVAEARFAAATNKLPQQYSRDLGAMLQKFQADGALDEFLAVKKEMARFKTAFSGKVDPFEEIPEFPESALVDSPEVLRTLQEGYISARREFVKTLASETEACCEKLSSRIALVQKELTKRGKIEEAIEIRDISEKIKSAIEDDTIVSYAASFATGGGATSPSSVAAADAADSTSVSADVAKDDSKTERKVRNPSAPWRKWKYESSMSFSPDLQRLFSPDLVSPVSVRVLDKAGFAAFTAANGTQPIQVGGTLCQWAGSALVWSTSAENLSVDFKISSRKLSSMMDKGPKLFIYIFSAGKLVEKLPVPLMQAECTVRIVKDTVKPGHYALFWPKAGISKQFDIAADATVKVIIGVALDGVREACDTTVQFE